MAKQTQSKKAPAKKPPAPFTTYDGVPAAVVEGEQAPSLPADPVAVVQREVVGLIKPDAVYRPAPNDSVPADIAQGTWGHAESYSADGASKWDEAYGAIRLSILASVRIGTTVALPNRNYGTTEVAGIGGVRRVDQLAGGLLVGIPVAPGGEPSPLTSEDRVNVFTLTRAVTLWCVTPDGEQRAVTFTPESGPYAAGIKTLAPVNGKPRSLPLWLAPLPLVTTGEVLEMLARVEASMVNQSALSVLSEIATPTEVLTV